MRLKTVAQPPGHLQERICSKDWPITVKESVKGGRKLGASHMTICGQLSKMNISCYKREKTPKYSEKQAEKAKNLCKKLEKNFLY